MTDLENSTSLHLCFRELETHEMNKDKKILFYKTTTQGG
jgi:hypothetical protein